MCTAFALERMERGDRDGVEALDPVGTPSEFP